MESDYRYVRLKGSSLGRTDLQPQDSQTRKQKSRCMEREGEVVEAVGDEDEGDLQPLEAAANVGREDHGVGLFDGVGI